MKRTVLSSSVKHNSSASVEQDNECESDVIENISILFYLFEWNGLVGSVLSC